MKWKRDLIEMRRERLAMPRIQAPAHMSTVKDAAALWSEMCKAPFAGCTKLVGWRIHWVQLASSQLIPDKSAVKTAVKGDKFRLK